MLPYSTMIRYRFLTGLYTPKRLSSHIIQSCKSLGIAILPCACYDDKFHSSSKVDLKRCTISVVQKGDKNKHTTTGARTPI